MELRDQAERRQSILLDEPVNILHDSYILSFKLSNLVASAVPIDVYVRLRGFEADSPLILFRDFENRMKEDLKLNLVFTLEKDIGSILQIDIAFDVCDVEDDVMVARSVLINFAFFTVYVYSKHMYSITEVELRNALRIDDDDLARGAIDENVFIANRGTAARIGPGRKTSLTLL